MPDSESQDTPAAEHAAPAGLPARPGLLEGLRPAVALVGRPNVGKSSLFNALLHEELAITDARAGTTRDRVLHPATMAGKACDLVDTGGIGIVDRGDLTQHVEEQIAAAVSAASVLVLVVDAKDGITSQDRDIAHRLRSLGSAVVVAANKSEGHEAGLTVAEFSALGFPAVVATSAVHRLGLDDLEEAVAALLPETPEVDAQLAGLPKIAVIGRRNVGKSSFVNALARQERAIVSDVPGTTRDAVDLLLQKDNQRFWLIDTAGLRRMKEPEGPVEFFAQVRTERAIRRADVVLFMAEATEGFSTTDQKTADLIVEEFKPCVLVVNKWDLMPGARTGDYSDYVQHRMPGLRNCPVCFTTAKDGRRCWQTLDVALDLYRLSRTEIPTPKLNQAIEQAEREHEPPARKNRKPRLLYGVQVGKGPPTIVVHCRHPGQIEAKYRRYLKLRLAELLGLTEIPLRIFLRESERPRRRG